MRVAIEVPCASIAPTVVPSHYVRKPVFVLPACTYCSVVGVSPCRAPSVTVKGCKRTIHLCTVILIVGRLCHAFIVRNRETLVAHAVSYKCIYSGCTESGRIVLARQRRPLGCAAVPVQSASYRPYLQHLDPAAAHIPVDPLIRRTPCGRHYILALAVDLCVDVIEGVAAGRLKLAVLYRYSASETLRDICGQVEAVSWDVLFLYAVMCIRTLLYIQHIRPGKRPCCDAVIVDSTGDIAVVLLYQVAL